MEVKENKREREKIFYFSFILFDIMKGEKIKILYNYYFIYLYIIFHFKIKDKKIISVIIL